MRRKRWFSKYYIPSSTSSDYAGAAEVTEEFNSWGEMIDKAEKLPVATYDIVSRDESVSYYCNRNEWAGGTFKAALSLARHGWHEAADMANKVASPIFDSLSSLIERPEVLYDVEGAAIDVAAYVQGEPECWQRWESKVVDSPAVPRIRRLVINGFYSAGIDNKVIIAKGAVLAAMVQLMEFAGIRIEVVWHCPFLRLADFRCVVKSADQDLDMGRLMFALAHPAMFRRIAFSLYEHHPKQRSRNDGYGSPVTLSPEVHKGDIYIDCTGYGDPQWTDEESTREWVLDKLKEQGAEIKEAA